MKTDLLLDPFGARWTHMRDAAVAAEAEGFDGVWTYDHLAGSVHNTSMVLECWTTLTAIAASVPRITIGSMVLNVANRDPGTLAVMAATLQEVSGGRLLLGIGAGGGRVTPYAAEQEALGRTVEPDPIRRAAVEQTAGLLREVWSGERDGVSGFLQPDPAPPIIIGAFGPLMAVIAGHAGDGINIPGMHGTREVLLATARESHRAAARNPDAFVGTASASLTPEWVRRDSAYRRELESIGVDRLVLFARPRDLSAIRQAGRMLRGEDG